MKQSFENVIEEALNLMDPEDIIIYLSKRCDMDYIYIKENIEELNK